MSAFTAELLLFGAFPDLLLQGTGQRAKYAKKRPLALNRSQKALLFTSLEV
jgi:hypothetical protein